MAATAKFSFDSYVKIIRIDHWFKNVFILPGIAFALFVGHGEVVWSVLPQNILFGIVAVCLIASANYAINEYADSEFDALHPVKKNRPGAQGKLYLPYVAILYALLVAAGLALASMLGRNFLIWGVVLLVMGWIYNIKPVRAKDLPIADVLVESVNNPLRFLLGWHIVLGNALPPSSILFAYWMGGAFLMAVKRFAEYRGIGDKRIAAAYRRSFAVYDERLLLVTAFFYAISASLFLGIFLIKYRVEFLLSFPLFAVLFSWYLWLGLDPDSAAEAPEKLYREKYFMAFVVLLTAAMVFLLLVDMPWLGVLTEPLKY